MIEKSTFLPMNLDISNNIHAQRKNVRNADSKPWGEGKGEKFFRSATCFPIWALNLLLS